MAVTWAASADKHGVEHADALHAIANAYFVKVEFDEPRIAGGLRPTLYIGPPRQLGGPLLEVIVVLTPPPRSAHFSRHDRPSEAPGPHGGAVINEKDSDALAEWAEHEISVTAPSRAVLRGTDAAAHGREALERALGGRPSLDPNARPGQHSRTRQVRLPSEANAKLDAVAAAQHRKPSEVMRDALDEYFRNHPDQAAS